MAEDTFLQKHSDLHNAFPEVSCIGGIYNYSGQAIRDLTYNYIQTRWLLQGQKGLFNSYLIGGNFSCKRSSLGDEKFDPKIVYGGSETEFFLRMSEKKNLKYKLFLDLPILHNTHLGTFEFCKKAFKQGVGSRYLRQKLQRDIEVNSDLKELIQFDEVNYQKKMEFWLALYNASYNQGYRSAGKYTIFRSALTVVLTYFNFYRIKASDFFGSLENLLKKLAEKIEKFFYNISFTTHVVYEMLVYFDI